MPVNLLTQPSSSVVVSFLPTVAPGLLCMVEGAPQSSRLGCPPLPHRGRAFASMPIHVLDTLEQAARAARTMRKIPATPHKPDAGAGRQLDSRGRQVGAGARRGTRGQQAGAGNRRGAEVGDPAPAIAAPLEKSAPSDDSVVPPKPTDGVVAPPKPTHGAVVAPKPADGAVAPPKPADGVVAPHEPAPTVGPVVLPKPADGAVALLKSAPAAGAVVAAALNLPRRVQARAPTGSPRGPRPARRPAGLPPVMIKSSPVTALA
jgi:hypothetical protein